MIPTNTMTDGFLLVDKESGFTSHDVVALARKKMATKKIGHAGTLDPMATGLLVLGVGIGTKLLSFIVNGVKSYEATIRLGASTSTDDKEGEIIAEYLPKKLSEEEVKKIVADAVAEVGAKSPQQMGQVMKIVQPKVAGKADGGFVSGLVKAALAGN